MKSLSLTDRIIFGLKVKQLRSQNKQSFADLAAATGMSLSYLNEIEKGKKYPKTDKVIALAKALGTKVDWLTDGHLDRHLAPVESLLRSNFLNELPLDLFGIELNKVVEIVANAPLRVAAFISTLLELSRSYNLGEENFYFGALRAYLELHDNFFPEIEQAVQEFSSKYDLPKERPLSPNTLARILEDYYDYNIELSGLRGQVELKGIRALFLPASNRLLLQEGLNDRQKAFQYGKESGFNFLKLTDRANTSSLMNARSFEEVINHSKATYFSAALHLPLEEFSETVKDLFAMRQWNADQFMGVMERYNVNPETFYHRLTNLIPHLFSFSNLFFLRFVHDTRSNSFTIDRELHLDRRNHPRANASNEHYCRRWLSTRMLVEMSSIKETSDAGMAKVSVQRSRYYGTEDEYLCITLARRGYPKPEQNVSVTIGLLVGEALRAFCNWVDDPAIASREVNTTCERCAIDDCTVRIVPPKVLLRRKRQQAIQRAIEGLED